MSPSGVVEPRTFLTEILPRQFERALREQERRVESAQRVLEEMRSADATLCVRVDAESFYLNLEKGRLVPGEAPATAPVLTLIQSRADFERLVEESGDSALGFLGALAGVGELRLTRSRLEALRGLSGCVCFHVEGERGFAVATHFGSEPVPEEPDTRIHVAPEVYAELRSGRLEPQNAFMSGQLRIEGDVQLAMQLALAALAPD